MLPVDIPLFQQLLNCFCSFVEKLIDHVCVDLSGLYFIVY